MTIIDVAEPEETQDPQAIRDAVLLMLIDQALADFSHLSLVDAAKVNDVLLDLRGAISA